MLSIIKRLLSPTPQNALRCPQTAESQPPRNRALEELQWHAEALEWELERQKRQEIIELAELARELEHLEAEAKRQWSRRMHRAKRAKNRKAA
jgi:hypothetical protein